jgi:AcrR family transcriptional regulator
LILLFAVDIVTVVINDSYSGDNGQGPRERIIAAAVQSIEAGGESAIRISSVARTARVTPGMISYYFGGREGLVQEAQLARFMATVSSDLNALEKMARDAQSVDEFREFLLEMTSEVVDLSRSPARASRLMAIGAALPRPDLLKLISEAQSVIVDAMEKVILIAQARDLIRNDLNPRAVAIFVLSYNTGLVVADIDRERPSVNEFTSVIGGFVEFLLQRPAPSEAQSTGVV